MAKKSVFCIAKSRAQAEAIVERLKGAGFFNNDISVLFPDKSSTREFAHEKNTKAPEGAAAGAGTGGAVGGALGWLAGIGALAIPGVGPFVAAGPIMAALSGAAVGAAMGGIAGALIGMGIPEYEAKRFEGRIREGGILISVHTDDSDQIRSAKDIFENAGAEDIGTAGEAGVDEKKGDIPAERATRSSTYVSGHVVRRKTSHLSHTKWPPTPMKTRNDPMNPLEELMLDELADILDAEKRLVQALPKMVNAATNDGLQAALSAHLAQTVRHVERLNRVFAAFGQSPKTNKCEAMTGLLEEADEIVADHKGSASLNAALISAAQKVEHYEIASYGCLCEWAEVLENQSAAELLKLTMGEEEAADEKLTSLARAACNAEAARNGKSSRKGPDDNGEADKKTPRATRSRRVTQPAKA